MSYCETHEFFDELATLIQKLSDGISLSAKESRSLKRLLDRWDETTCPDAGCVPETCPYAKLIDWVEYEGYDCLFSLIQNLDQTNKITKIPKGESVDPLDAPWARRPGHYNP